MEIIDIKYWKLLSIYSLILGAVSGLLSVISIFMPFFSLFFLPFLGCIPPLALIIFKDGFYSNENKTYAILGGYSGLCLSAGYVLTFVPTAFIVHFFLKSYYFGNIVKNLNIYLIVMFFVMIALIYIITNCVTALLFGLTYKYFKESANGKNN